MEYIYLLLKAQSFRDDELDITLTPEKPSVFLDASNISQRIYDSLASGALVQVSREEFYNSTITPVPITSIPLEEPSSPIRPVPFIYAVSPLNVLPSLLDSTKYYILGDHPIEPFAAYPQYVVRKNNNVFKLYKPENGDVGIIGQYVTEQYFGIWPDGQWIKVDNTPAPEVAPTVTVWGDTIVNKLIKDQAYSSVNLESWPEFPTGAVVKGITILREGSPIYPGVDSSEYSYNPTTKIITFNTPVAEVERIIYMISIKPLTT